MLYFAYGSNLNIAELRRAWGHEPKFVSTAFWPDAALRFHYHSTARAGGALDLVEHVGAATPGVLFEADLEVLDRKEGVGRGNYRRIEGTVLTSQGPRRAITYRVTDGARQNQFVPPTSDYVAIVREGMHAFELPSQTFDAACANKTPNWPKHVFVYGTLMRGEERESLMRNDTLQDVTEASVAGQLVDLGAYPGLRTGRFSKGGARVSGELFAYSSFHSLFAVLDPVEDFEGWDCIETSMYYRTIVGAQTQGTAHWAWTYEYRGERRGEIIESGCWNRR